MSHKGPGIASAPLQVEESEEEESAVHYQIYAGWASIVYIYIGRTHHVDHLRVMLVVEFLNVASTSNPPPTIRR